MKKLILVLLALCMAATAFATVSTNPGRNEYTAAAAQTIFNYTFKIYASTDLLVYQTPTGQDPDDTADLITGYTVAGVGVDAGGSITLNSGATSGDLITIVSGIPTNRTVDYQFNGDFLPDVVNGDFDRAVSLVKQLESTTTNALTYQNSFQGGAGTLPDPVAGNVIGYDGSGNLTNLLLGVDGNSWDGLTDLGDNTIGKGSDLVAHTSTAFTVTESLDSLSDSILGDGTAGRVLRSIRVIIQDGTNANTLKVTVENNWNGDVIAETDNVAKSATTGDFTLDATGQSLSYPVTGDCIAVLAELLSTNSTPNAYIPFNFVSSGDIMSRINLSNGGGTQDFTAVVDVGNVSFRVLYLTDE